LGLILPCDERPLYYLIYLTMSLINDTLSLYLNADVLGIISDYTKPRPFHASTCKELLSVFKHTAHRVVPDQDEHTYNSTLHRHIKMMIKSNNARYPCLPAYWGSDDESYESSDDEVCTYPLLSDYSSSDESSDSDCSDWSIHV